MLSSFLSEQKKENCNEIPNVIEIEGLLFQGFGRVLANAGAPSSDVTRALKNGAL